MSLSSFPAYTPEELTALRRKERQAAKIERARLAVRAGTQLPDGIVALGGELEEDLPSSLQGLESNEAQIGDTYGEHIPGLIYFKPAAKPRRPIGGEPQEPDEEDIMDVEVEQLERFVLSREETFFLAGMMDCLEVRDQNVSTFSQDWKSQKPQAFFIDSHTLLLTTHFNFSGFGPFYIRSLLFTPSLFSTTFHSWILSSFSKLRNQRSSRFSNDSRIQLGKTRQSFPPSLHCISSFQISRMGGQIRKQVLCGLVALQEGTCLRTRRVSWKTRIYSVPSIDTDHASTSPRFAVLVIPVYSDPKDEESSPFNKHPSYGEKSWVWFSTMNRVNSQVQKVNTANND